MHCSASSATSRGRASSHRGRQQFCCELNLLEVAGLLHSPDRPEMASQLATVSSFVEGAPPGEVRRHIPVFKAVANQAQARRCHSWYESVPQCWNYKSKDVGIDIKALTIETPTLVSQLGPAFEKYNEEQFATVKLPGSSQYVRLNFADLMKDLADLIILRS